MESQPIEKMWEEITASDLDIEYTAGFMAKKLSKNITDKKAFGHFASSRDN